LPRSLSPNKRFEQSARSEAAPLGAVIAAHHEITARGKLLALVCCAPFMDRLIELAGAGTQLWIHGTLKEAVASLPDDC